MLESVRKISRKLPAVRGISVGEVFDRRTCRVCGSVTPIEHDKSDNYRESFHCLSCYCLVREHLVARVILKRYAKRHKSLREAMPRLGTFRIHEFGFVGAIHNEFQTLSGFSCSDYFPGVQPGEAAPNGVDCQDLHHLTFGDEEFDLVISQDVLEHVPDPSAALAETHRVLRASGRHILTVPFSAGRRESIPRAQVAADGRIDFLLPAVYHGDPIREEGALVFTDFGTDLFSLFGDIGFTTQLHVIDMSNRPGGYVAVIEAVRR